jgi:DNA polymerase I-like protein with 3'-5' exonuclease and polymerase domains
MIQYGSSAKAISELNFVKVKVAEAWIEGHKRAYPTFHIWAANVGRLAEARGWAATQLGTMRWVMEGNAKGQEEGAAGRLAVSQLIQGLIHWPL